MPTSIGLLAEPFGMLSADQLHGADHARRPFELLARQQPQRVAHERRSAAARAWVLQPAPDDQERDQAQVGLGLAAAGRKPDQIQHVPKTVVLPNRGFHDRQQKRQLERAPPVTRRLGLPALDPVGLAHLIEHRPVGQPERLGHDPVGAEQIDRPLHATAGHRHSVANAGGGSPLAGDQQAGGRVSLFRGPGAVAGDEARQVVGSGCTGEMLDTENRMVAGVDRHQRCVDRGHELGPDAGGPVRFDAPVDRRAVADRVDVSIPVLELELLFLLRQQTRVDARVLDDLTGRHDALQPRLEQRPFRQILGSRTQRIRHGPVAAG